MAVMDKLRSLHDAIAADVGDDMSRGHGLRPGIVGTVLRELRNNPPEEAKSDSHRADFRHAVRSDHRRRMREENYCFMGWQRGCGIGAQLSPRRGSWNSPRHRNRRAFQLYNRPWIAGCGLGYVFLPTRTVKGSDFRSGDQFASIRCPFTNDELLAVRAIRPDVAILHVQRADKEGNAHAWGNFGVMREAAFAAKKVILTCEEIVDHDLILSDPNRNVIPGFLVSSVVHQPFGSHPSPTQGYARRDDDFYFQYHKATRSREGFEQWLQTWVFEVKDHHEFLDLLGKERVEKLMPKGNHFSPAVSFSY